MNTDRERLNGNDEATPIVDQIETAILNAISAGRLPPGAKLGEGQLAKLFDASRTIVRQALQRLAYLGVVRLESNRGAFVASTTRKEAADLYEARRIIETATIASLARDCTANDIRVLRQHIEEEREARESSDWHRLVQVRARFHLKIAELSGNQLLVEFLERILPRTAMIATFYRYPPRQPASAHDHERLLDLLMAGDVQGSVAFMEAHLDIDEKKLQIPDKPSTSRVDLSKALEI
jgi:DNA-binding GntR family transcriptional regulator